MDQNLFTRIYGSAVDSGLWTEAIDGCVQYVGSASAAIISVETDGSLMYNLNVLSEHFRDESQQQNVLRWQSEFAHYDADGVVRSASFPVFSPFTDKELWPEPGLDSRPDIVFLQQQMGLRRRIAARLSDNPRFIQAIAFQFASDIADVPASAAGLVRSVCPHVAKSLELSFIFQQLKSHYDAVLAVLDKVGIGICIVRADGAVVSKNTEAERVFNDSGLIGLTSNNRIKMAPAKLDARLSDYIMASSLANSFATIAEQVISVKDKNDENPIIVEVSPLQDHYREIEAHGNFVFVQLLDTGSHQKCNVERFASAYGLTEAESNIASLVTEGLNSNEIAEIRSTAVNTVRKQVKNIMEKTGARNRIELIRQIIKTDPPIGKERITDCSPEHSR